MDDSPIWRPVTQLDARSLRALAHPLRIRILSVLRLDGPTTATRLAARLEQDSGNVSWHLRQLADHGFIAEDAERGTRRERWWYAVHRSTELDEGDFAADPDSREAMTVYLHQVLDQYFERASAFVAEDWDPRWRRAAGFSDWRIDMSADQLSDLSAKLQAVVEQHARDVEWDRASTTADVHIQLQAFPRKPRP